MSSELLNDETTAHGLEAAVALVLKAEDSGEWKPVADWLALNPTHAVALAEFLAAQRGLRIATSEHHSTMVRAGSSLAQFELQKEIGRGGMGVVYRAFDTVLKRDVAVKLLRSSEAYSATESARFRYEAELVASLNHPNIVLVHSFGEADGVPYLVMPLMTGGSLANWLKGLDTDRRLPPKRAAEIVRDIAVGVHHAHQRGLIHRDIKPGNVLLDRDGTPHIADFGLARRIDVTASTSAGIAGTVAYMAPEQARGDTQLTTAVDVHALGVVLFELLTGAVPFGGTDLPSVLRRVAEEEAPPVSRFRKDVPTDLESISAKCLEKVPTDRYRSAQELADDLGNFLDDRPVHARPPGFWDWLRQLARTRPAPHPNPAWPVTAWFGAIVLAANVAIYAMVQVGWPAAGVWAINLVGGACLVFVLWWYMLRRFRQIPMADRHSLIIAAGCVCLYFPLLVAYVPLSLSAPALDGLELFPAQAACSGLGLFVLGSTYWSRFFPIGLVIMAVVPVLARWPDESPLVYGIVVALVLWYWSYAKHDGFGARSSTPV